MGGEGWWATRWVGGGRWGWGSGGGGNICLKADVHWGSLISALALGLRFSRVSLQVSFTSAQFHFGHVHFSRLLSADFHFG